MRPPVYSLHLKKPTPREYSSSPGGPVTKWLSRKFLTVLTLAGVSAGALVIVSSNSLKS